MLNTLLKDRTLLLLVVISLIAQSSFSQTTFQKIYGGNGDEGIAKVLQTADGGFLYAGYTDSWGSSSFRDGYIMKTDASGSIQWAKTYGEPGEQDEIFDIISASDGGYAFVGTAQQGPSLGATKILFGKIDSAGNVQYQKSYVYTTWEIGWEITQSPDGGYMIIADSRVNGIYYDIVMIKIDSTGNLQWAKANDGTPTNFEFNPVFVHSTEEGGYVVVGQCYLSVPPIPSTLVAHALVFKTDSAGFETWKYSYQSVDTNYQIRTFGATFVPGEGYYIVGIAEHMISGTGYALLIKTALDGTLKWAKGYSPTSPGISHETFSNIEYVSEDKMILQGRSSDLSGAVYWTGVLMDTSGTILWHKEYTYLNSSLGQNIFLSSNVLPTNDGGYLFPGWGTVGFSSIDIYSVKTDANGNSGCWEDTLESASINFPMVAVPYSGSYTIGTSQGFLAWTLDTGNDVTTLCEYLDSIPTGVNENIYTDSGISVYPNPASEMIYVDSKDRNISQIQILNLLGEETASQNVNTHRSQVSTSHLENGIYFLKIYFSDKSIELKKIQVVRNE